VESRELAAGEPQTGVVGCQFALSNRRGLCRGGYTQGQLELRSPKVAPVR